MLATTVTETQPMPRAKILRHLAIELLEQPAFRAKPYAGQLLAILMAAHYENEGSDIRQAALERATTLFDEARSDLVVVEVIAVSFPQENIGRKALAEFIARSDKEDARIRDIAAGLTLVGPANPA